MSHVRTHIREASLPDLGFSQFKILANIERGVDTASCIAELHGVSRPAVSKMVDGLVNSNLLSREESADDRRTIKLKLTPKGCATIKEIKKEASKSFEGNLNLLTPAEKVELVAALECLDSFFTKIQENKV